MRYLFCLIAIVFFHTSHAQEGKNIIHKLYDAYAGKWYKTFSFVQRTEVYRNDSLIRTSTWYEAARFPFDFRISMGDPRNANGMIYKKDSTYRFEKGLFKNAVAGNNPFTFLLGGMYFLPFDSVTATLQSRGYDLSKNYTTTWKNRKTYVVGATPSDSTSTQLWIDAENLYLVRTIEIDRGTRVDAQMSGQVRVGHGWSETRVEFYFNGKLRQIETYSDLKGDIALDEHLFDPDWYNRVNWMN